MKQDSKEYIPLLPPYMDDPEADVGGWCRWELRRAFEFDTFDNVIILIGSEDVDDW